MARSAHRAYLVLHQLCLALSVFTFTSRAAQPARTVNIHSDGALDSFPPKSDKKALIRRERQKEEPSSGSTEDMPSAAAIQRPVAKNDDNAVKREEARQVPSPAPPLKWDEARHEESPGELLDEEQQKKVQAQEELASLLEELRRRKRKPMEVMLENRANRQTQKRHIAQRRYDEVQSEIEDAFGKYATNDEALWWKTYTPAPAYRNSDGCVRGKEELFAGVCYKKCSLFAHDASRGGQNGGFTHRSSPFSCRKTGCEEPANEDEYAGKCYKACRHFKGKKDKPGYLLSLRAGPNTCESPVQRVSCSGSWWFGTWKCTYSPHESCTSKKDGCEENYNVGLDGGLPYAIDDEEPSPKELEDTGCLKVSRNANGDKTYQAIQDGHWSCSCKGYNVNHDESEKGGDHRCPYKPGLLNADCPSSGTKGEKVFNADYTDYRGCADTTINGRTCQKWSSQVPWRHDLCTDRWNCGSATDKDNGLGNFNWCRNPPNSLDKKNHIWCFTTDPNVEVEACCPLDKTRQECR